MCAIRCVPLRRHLKNIPYGGTNCTFLDQLSSLIYKVFMAYTSQRVTQMLADVCLFVCVRSGRILHGAAVFDRERLYMYGTTPLTSILLDFS